MRLPASDAWARSPSQAGPGANIVPEIWFSFVLVTFPERHRPNLRS
jgi:hypothetical protein